MRNLFYFLILSLIVFGGFAFASNIKCSKNWSQQGIALSLTNTILISLGPKIYLEIIESNNLLIWQVWLGLALVVFFMCGYMLME
jgi:hypothetical protein